MYPFSSYTSQRIVHDHMVQEAMQQVHIDAQLHSSKTPHRILQHFLRLLTRLPLSNHRRHSTVRSIVLNQNSYSHHKPVSYPDCDSGTAC
jgi:hypothetical protein